MYHPPMHTSGTGDPRAVVDAAFAAHLELAARVAEGSPERIAAAAALLSGTLRGGGKVLICGNGGSAADAQHFAAELVGRFGRPGTALPAIALTVDTSVLTALGNDQGFSEIFARQVDALGTPGDLLVAITTSGRSRNVLRAVERARAGGLAVLALTGSGGEATLSEVDVAVCVPSEDTQRIQEMHSVILHVIGEIAVREVG
jgi:D-sedoheptulose 7-phosphate isomerase